MSRRQGERGGMGHGGEEETGVPPTGVEERAAERPSGVPPGATTGPDDQGERGEPRGHGCGRPEELSPDDFE